MKNDLTKYSEDGTAAVDWTVSAVPPGTDVWAEAPGLLGQQHPYFLWLFCREVRVRRTTPLVLRAVYAPRAP